MGIRIDPTLEFVWRDPATIQLGVDPPRAVVAVPTTGEERFLNGLRRETGHDVLSGLADRVGVLARNVAAGVLGAASPAVVDVLPEPLDRDRGARRRCPRRRRGGAPVRRGRDGQPHPAPARRPVVLPEHEPRLAVVVADHVVDPALRAAWTRRGVPHLAVVVGDGRVRLGPFVVPGSRRRASSALSTHASTTTPPGRPSPPRCGAAPRHRSRRAERLRSAAAATRMLLERLPLRTQQAEPDRSSSSATTCRSAVRPVPTPSAVRVPSAARNRLAARAPPRVEPCRDHVIVTDRRARVSPT